MKRFEIKLEGAPENAFLDAYIPRIVHGEKRRALLVIPGGGYRGLAEDREGEPIAEAFIPYGFTPFVLHYYTGGEKPFPLQLIQASYAIKHIKDNADEYGISSDEIFTVGFSAGGHLAGCLAIMPSHGEIYDGTGIEPEYIRPRGAMLIYPVVTPEYHFSSFKNLWCEEAPCAKALDLVSLDKQADERSAPLFILHTANDQMVDVRNSLAIAEAYSALKKEYELHIFPDAPHGIALANPITSRGHEKWDNKRIAEWVRISAEWAEELIEKTKNKDNI